MNKTFNQTKKEIVNFLDEVTHHEYSYPMQREFNRHDPFTPEEIATHTSNAKIAQQNIQVLKSLATTDEEYNDLVKLNSYCYYELSRISVLADQKSLFTDPDLTNTDFFIYLNDKYPETYLYLNEENRSNPKLIDNVLMQLNTWGRSPKILIEKLDDKVIDMIPKIIRDSLEFNVSLHKYEHLAKFSKLTGFTSPEDLSIGMKTAISHNTKDGAHALIEQAPMDMQNEIEKTFVSFYPFLSERMRANEDTIIKALSINPENIFEIPDNVKLSEDVRKKVLSVAVKEILPPIAQEIEEHLFSFSIANKIEKLSQFLSNNETNKKIKHEIENPDEFFVEYCYNLFYKELKEDLKNNQTETVKSPKIKM